MAEQDITALKQMMWKRFGRESVLEMDGATTGLPATPSPSLTPAADASQSLISGETPPTLPEGTPQEAGPLGEQKSNAAVVVEALANVLKKLIK